MSCVPLAMGYFVGLPLLRLLQHALKGGVILVLLKVIRALERFRIW